MAHEPILLTPEGKTKLEAELAALRDKRPELAERVANARDDAAFGEDTTLDTAQRDQVMLEARIQELERILAEAQLIDAGKRRVREKVEPGYTVTVVDESGKESEYTIVGSVEADPLAGRISNVSPVGSALMGKRPGDSVEVRVPAGILRLTIKDIH
ncbi:MAG TPA: transcription elongation factor GreA [Chloroflexota bacterium]